MFSNYKLISTDKKNFWFFIFITYQTLAFFYVPFSASIDRFSFSYFALVIPPWVFIAANYKNLITDYKPASLSFAIFGITAGLFGALKGDFSLSYNAIYISTLVIVILNSKVYLKDTDINKIFLLVIFGSIILQLLNMTQYNIFPIVPNISCLDVVDWRVSLFRVPTEGAILSFLVVIINLHYIKSINNWLRMLIVFLALYFLVFSAIRGVVFPAFSILSIYLFLLMKRATNAHRKFLVTWLGAALIVIVCLPFLLGAKRGFWENYIFRSATCEHSTFVSAPKNVNNNSMPWILATLNRQCTISHQLNLFLKAPLGSKDILPQSEKVFSNTYCQSQDMRTYCSSCVFATYWLARAGIFAFPLILGFFLLLKEAFVQRRIEVFLTLSFFIMLSFFWGGVFVPYNFSFLFLLIFPAFFLPKKSILKK